MKPIRLTLDEIRPVLGAESGAEFVRWLARVVGPGFHPDNPVDQYHFYLPVPGSGMRVDHGPVFAPRTARLLEGLLDHACAFVADPCAVAKEVLFDEPEVIVPDTAWRLVQDDIPAVDSATGEEEWPGRYATRREAEEQLQQVMMDMAEDQRERARLLRWFRVERVEVPSCPVR